MEPRPSPHRRFYDATEAAAVLGVSPDHVRRMVREGRLPGRRIGRLYRLPMQQIDALGSVPALREDARAMRGGAMNVTWK